MSRSPHPSPPRHRRVFTSLCAAALGAGLLAAGALPASARDVHSQVDLFRPDSGSLIRSFNASFSGGDAVAMGDLTKDGAEEVVVANTNGGHITVQDAFGHVISSFDSAYDGSGDKIAVGDVSGDGAAEIVVANDEGGRIDVLDLFGDVISSFDSAYDGDDQVAVGEVTGDSFGEIIVANTEGGGRMDVLAFGDAIAGFGSTGFDASEELAVGNILGDARNEIVIANDEQSGRVNVYGGLGGIQRSWSSGLHAPEVVVGNLAFGSLDDIGVIEKQVGSTTATSQSLRVYTSTGQQIRTVPTSFTPRSGQRFVADSIALGNLVEGSLDEVVVGNV